MVSSSITIGNPRSPFTIPIGDEDYPYPSELTDISHMNNNNNPLSSGYGDHQRAGVLSKKMPKEFPQRYIIVIMGFLAFVNIYMMYLNLSVAMPAMIDHHKLNSSSVKKEKSFLSYAEKRNQTETKREKRHRNAKTKINKEQIRHKIHLHLEEVVRALAEANISEQASVSPPSDIITVPKIKLSDKLTKEILAHIREAHIDKTTESSQTTVTSVLIDFKNKNSSISSKNHPLFDVNSENMLHLTASVNFSGADIDENPSTSNMNDSLSAKDNTSHISIYETVNEKNIENNFTRHTSESESENKNIVVNETESGTAMNESNIVLSDLLQKASNEKDIDIIHSPALNTSALNTKRHQNVSNFTRVKRSLNNTAFINENSTTFAPMVAVPVNSNRRKIKISNQPPGLKGIPLPLRHNISNKDPELPELSFAKIVTSVFSKKAISELPIPSQQISPTTESTVSKETSSTSTPKLILSTINIVQADNDSKLGSTDNNISTESEFSQDIATINAENIDITTSTSEQITEIPIFDTISEQTLKLLEEKNAVNLTSTENNVMANNKNEMTSLTEEIFLPNDKSEKINDTSQLLSDDKNKTKIKEKSQNDKQVGIPLPTLSLDSIETSTSAPVTTPDVKEKVSFSFKTEISSERSTLVIIKGNTTHNETVFHDSSENVIENSSDINFSQDEKVSIAPTESENLNEVSVKIQTTPLPCRIFQDVNCTYDVIDNQGIKSSSPGETNWVTLRPLPTGGPYRRRKGYFWRRYGRIGFNSNERRPRIRKVYNFTDNFSLQNCSRLNYTQSSRNSDIECMSVLGPIRLNIIAENENFSSSSSSEEDSEEDDDEDEEEGENDDDDERGIRRRNNLRRRKGHRRRRKYFRRNTFKNRRRKLNISAREENKDNKDYDDEWKKKVENTERHLSPKFRSVNPDEDLMNIDGTWGDYAGEKDCGESSEECGDKDEEEGEEDEREEDEDGEGEDEENENQLRGRPGSSSPIRLDEKIPSTVCFVKKIVSEVTYEGLEGGEFTWSKSLQNQILGAYYWGFLLSQIPGARLSSIIGGKLTLLIGVLCAGILTLLTPVMASSGPYWLLTGRVAVGMMQGLTMPAIQALLSQWAPPIERTRMVACTYSGIAFGAALGGPLCEYLVRKIGWKVIFYGQGILALIWGMFWFFLASESPHTHPKITEKEKQYVTSSIGQQHSYKNLPVPWCSILRSRHVLGLMLAQGSFIWAWHTLLHYAPMYIDTVLHRERSEVQGVWGAALGCMFIASCSYGFIADWLRKSRKTSTESIRRAANSICSLLGAVFLVGVAQSYCNITAVEICFALAIAVGFPGAFSGIYANSIDLAPNHAGVITAICNSFATTANILSPFYWSLIVYERPTLERWRTIWYTSAIFLLLANCLYFLLVGSKEQRWNRPVMLTKSPITREEEHGAISRRRKAYTHGIKNQAFASTEHL